MAKRGRKPGSKVAPTPTTAKNRAKAIALLREGLSQRDVTARLGVPRSTVQRWAREAELAGREPPPAVAAEAVRELAAEPALEVRTEGLDEAELTRQIGDVSEMLEQARDSGEVMDYVRLARLRADLIVARARSRPPVPPDPANDPANAEAQRLVRAMLAGVAEPPRRSA